MTILDLIFNGYSATLVSDDNNQPALWITDEYMAERIDDPASSTRYTLNDTNSRVTVGADEDLDELVESWKRAVEWEESA